jgi:hypothetical protein
MGGMTLLGILPELPDRLTDPAQAATAAHCVHQIRTMLQINSGEGRNVFAVTSASPGDGRPRSRWPSVCRSPPAAAARC